MTFNGLGYIPFSEIAAYGKAFGYTSFDEKRRLVRFIGLADSAYVVAIKKRYPDEPRNNSKARNK